MERDRWPTLTAGTGKIVLIREQRFAWMRPVTIETENNHDVLQQTSRPVTTNRSRIVPGKLFHSFIRIELNPIGYYVFTVSAMLVLSGDKSINRQSFSHSFVRFHLEFIKILFQKILCFFNFENELLVLPFLSLFPSISKREKKSELYSRPPLMISRGERERKREERRGKIIKMQFGRNRYHCGLSEESEY